MKKLLIFCFVLLQTNLFSQNNIADHWFDANESAINISSQQQRTIVPESYRTLALDLEALKASLKNAPMEFTVEAKQAPKLITLPLPNGENATFEVFESPVMAAGLAAKFPEIKTFAGQGVDNPHMRVRFLFASKGLRGMIDTPDGLVIIDPYLDGNLMNYISYFQEDLLPSEEERTIIENGHTHTDESLIDHLELLKPNTGGPNSPFRSPNNEAANTRSLEAEAVELRVYRLAIAAPAEYTATQGGTVAGALSEILFATSLMNFIYEKETAVRFELVPNNDEIIFLDAATDPYNGPANSDYFQQNNAALNSIIGNANFDIGHVFVPSGCTSVGGNVVGGSSGGFGTVCSDLKAFGVSCSSSPNSAFYIRVLAHEMGHQLGALHTWSNCTPFLNGEIANPNPQLNSQAAYEPGGGTTILSYAGSCGTNNVQFSADPYLHVNSIEAIHNFAAAGGNGDCGTLLISENIKPEITVPIGDGLFIPISTPFQLTGVATDENLMDTLTYCWEQYNLGPISPLGQPMGDAPSFRTYPPTENPTRIFPRMQNIIANTSTDVEVLPTYSRNLTFRCTARDSKWGGGGTVWEEISFEATEEAGPFLVTNPTVVEQEFQVGEYVEVTWDVANTDAMPVNSQRVNILLSTNGGNAFPITLAEQVPNTGSYTIVIPNEITNTARIKIEAADNIFFDISNWNFKILPATESGYALSAGPYLQSVCLPDLTVFEINTLSLLDYDSLIQMEVIGLPDEITATFSSNPLTPSENATLTLDVENTIDADDFYTFELMAFVPNGDTVYQTLQFEVASSNFSDVATLEPINGATGLSELPLLKWSAGAAADEYEIQIANDPSFSATSIIETAVVQSDTFQTNSQLSISSTFFWRVRPISPCRIGDWLPINAFATKSLSCSSVMSTNDPLTISGNGLPTVESVINIPTDGVISDLNIVNIEGNHTAFKDLAMYLVAPDETEVELFHSVFCVATQFDFGIDDEASGEIGSDCPVNTMISYTPENPLTAFDGKNAQGDWTLKVSVINTAGSGGKLNSWELQVCSEANLSPPALITNEVMPVPPGVGRSITNEFLLTEDPNNSSDQIIYTIVTLPENGRLFFINDELGVGDKFSQQSASAGNIIYSHDGSMTDLDQFTFTVEDGEGGLIATPQFNIVIDPDVVISTDDILNRNDISIFPNPTRDLINIGFSNPINEQIMVRIFNVQGQMLAEKIVDNSQDLIQMKTGHFASGIYFVQVRTEKDSLTERVTVQR